MKKLLLTVAVLLALTCLLPLAAFAEAAPADTSAETTRLCMCADTPAAAYCPTCGGLNPTYQEDRWDCPTCEAKDNMTPFCPMCGEKHPAADRFWTCPVCEQTDNFYAECHRCGASRPAEDSGARFAFNLSSLGETLPIMGMGMLGIFLVIGTIAVAVIILRKLPEKEQED